MDEDEVSVRERRAAMGSRVIRSVKVILGVFK